MWTNERFIAAIVKARSEGRTEVFRAEHFENLDLSMLELRFIATDCTFIGVKFNGAAMETAQFSDCILEDCSFIGTDLYRFTMTSCRLERTTFREARLDSGNMFGCYGVDVEFPDKLPESANFDQCIWTLSPARVIRAQSRCNCGSYITCGASRGSALHDSKCPWRQA